MATLGAGGFFGAASMLYGESQPLTARALDDCHVAVFDCTALQAVLEQFPWCRALMEEDMEPGEAARRAEAETAAAQLDLAAEVERLMRRDPSMTRDLAQAMASANLRVEPALAQQVRCSVRPLGPRHRFGGLKEYSTGWLLVLANRASESGLKAAAPFLSLTFTARANDGRGFHARRKRCNSKLPNTSKAD